MSHMISKNHSLTVDRLPTRNLVVNRGCLKKSQHDYLVGRHNLKDSRAKCNVQKPLVADIPVYGPSDQCG